MAARDCHDEPAAVWACACAPAQAFCVTCLLAHVQGPGAHTVSHRGPPGQYLCGMCKGVIDSAIYSVCLCRSCVEHLSVDPYPGEVQAKVMEARPPAEAVEQREAHPSLSSLLAQKRNDVRQRLAQVLDNMNNFEDIIAQAIVLDRELTQCKKRLRAAEAALAEKSVQRPGAERLIEPAQFVGIVEKVETVTRENERLKNDNRSLLERVQTLEKQLVNQQSLTTQIHSLSEEIAQLKEELQETLKTQVECARQSSEQLQDSLQEQLQATSRTAALKVADVIPLVAHLKVDSDWLNSETAENLFQLASLGISNVLNSADVRFVARVSLLLAKLLGPCDQMVAFSKAILDLVTKNPERGVNLLKHFESVYLRAKGEAKLPDVIKEAIAIMGTRECEDAMSVSAKISKLLSLGELCDFSVAVLRYFCLRNQSVPVWKGALMDLPLDWTDQQLAEKCLRNMMLMITNGNFTEEHLALIKLLEAFHHLDQATIMTFVERARELLNHDPPNPQLLGFILEILSQVEFAQRMPAAEGQQFYECLNEAMKLLGQSATAEETVKMHLLLRELNPRSRHFGALVPFVQLFRQFTAEDKLQAFSFGALNCLFPNEQVRDNIAFASSLFRQLRNLREFEETATTVVDLLRSLLSCEVPDMVEACMTNMLALGAQLKQAVLLCLYFISTQQATSGLVGTWMAMLSMGDQQVRDISTAAALLEMGLQDCLYSSIYLFAQIVGTRLPDAPALIREVHSVLRDSASDRELLPGLLATAVAVVSGADRPTELTAKCLAVWKGGRTRVGTQIYAFCQHVLKNLGIEKTKKMLDALIDVFAQATITPDIVSILLNMYTADGNNPSTLVRQLAALRKIREAETLGPLLAKLRDRPMQPQHRALTVCALLDLCETGNPQTTCSEMDSLIGDPETTQLLTVLSQLQEYGVVKDLLGTAGRNNPVGVAAQLASVFVGLEAQGVREVSLSANVKTALLQHSAELGVLLPKLLVLLQDPRNRMGELCIRVLGDLSERGAGELLGFACDMAKDLMDSAQPNAIIALVNLVLAARQEAAIVAGLQKNLQQLKAKLVELLNRVQDRVTLRDVEGLMHTQATELVNVQPTLLRFFDFASDQWGPSVQLNKRIQIDSSDSSVSQYTILDDGTVFCCGGTSQAGRNSSSFNSGSTTHTAGQAIACACIVSRNGAVTDLPPMKGARYRHGVIFVDSNRTTYVFGGGK